MEPTTELEVQEVEFLPYKCWITTKAENLPYLQSLGVVVGPYTGTQYQACSIPVYAILDMMDNWGEVTFGNEEDNSTGPEHFVRTVLKYHSTKAIPQLVQMGMMKPPAARKL